MSIQNSEFYPGTPFLVKFSNLNNFGTVKNWGPKFSESLIISTLSTNNEKNEQNLRDKGVNIQKYRMIWHGITHKHIFITSELDIRSSNTNTRNYDPIQNNNDNNNNDVNGSRLAEQGLLTGRCSWQGNNGHHLANPVISKRRKWTGQENKIVMECYLLSESKIRGYKRRMLSLWL